MNHLFKIYSLSIENKTESNLFLDQSFNYLFRLMVDCVLFFACLLYFYIKEKKYKKNTDSNQLFDLISPNTAQQWLITLTNNINNGIIVVILGTEYKISFMNEGYLRMIGYTRKELSEEKNNNALNLLIKEDQSDTIHSIETQLKTSKNIVHEHRLLRRNGEIIWVLLKGEMTVNGEKNRQLNCIVVDITKTKKMEHTKQLNERKYQIAMEHSNHIYFDFDIKRHIIKIPNNYSKKYGWKPRIEDVPQVLFQSEFIHPNNKYEAEEVIRKINAGKKMASFECQLKTEKNRYTWFKVSLIRISETEDQVVGVLEDISIQKEAALHYLQEQKNREAILGKSTDYFQVNFTQNKILHGSKGWFDGHDFLADEKYNDIINKMAENEIYRDDVDLFLECFDLNFIFDSFEKGKTEISVEYRKKQKEDTYLWILTTLFLIQDVMNRELTGFVQNKNIDDQKKKELSWRFKAERDSLSGFYNKGTTEKILSQYIKMEGKNSIHALFVIDIDNFKVINDSYGHVFGDTALSKIAACIRGCIRGSDVIGRIGGDEFMILLKDMPNADFAEYKAEEICYHLGQIKIGAGEYCVKVSVSIGIAVYPVHGTTFEELYLNADRALYESKEKGKNTYSLYDK